MGNIIKLGLLILIGVLFIVAAFLGNFGSILSAIFYPGGMIEGGISSVIQDVTGTSSSTPPAQVPLPPTTQPGKHPQRGT